MPNILIVDDEKNILKTMDICFKDMGFDTVLCANPAEVSLLLQDHDFDLAFVDLKMEPIDGFEILKEIKLCAPLTTVIIMTAHGSVESAVKAIKLGAYNYLQKPFDYLELQIFADKVLEHHNLKSEFLALKEKTGWFRGDIITRHGKMREMIDLAQQSASTNLSILIEGESGTGKELFANLIHSKSERSNKPFIKVNCAALPEGLLESELFGHVKGAFTGATKDRTGRFEAADGGTILLDEIAEMSSALQAKLLRVLQNHEFEKVGESKTRKTDVRIIASTNRNLDDAIKEGSFRDDLFFRLNSVRLKLIPLRDRPEDIPLLIHYFQMKFSEKKLPLIPKDVIKTLLSYKWPGNVRELENVMERIILLSNENTIKPDSLPEEIRNSGNNTTMPLSLDEIEKNHIRKVLQFAPDLNEASRILGIDPATLYRKRKKYSL